MITFTAIVTTDTRGLLNDDSTLTINGNTVPIPATAPFGTGTTRFAPTRISVALAHLGYQFADNYRDTACNGAGTYTFRAVPL